MKKLLYLMSVITLVTFVLAGCFENGTHSTELVQTKQMTESTELHPEATTKSTQTLTEELL